MGVRNGYSNKDQSQRKGSTQWLPSDDICWQTEATANTYKTYMYQQWGADILQVLHSGKHGHLAYGHIGLLLATTLARPSKRLKVTDQSCMAGLWDITVSMSLVIECT